MSSPYLTHLNKPIDHLGHTTSTGLNATSDHTVVSPVALSLLSLESLDYLSWKRI